MPSVEGLSGGNVGLRPCQSCAEGGWESDQCLLTAFLVGCQTACLPDTPCMCPRLPCPTPCLAPALQRASADEREELLAGEVSDLQRRCAEAEARQQEAAARIPEATQPLMRQLESMQVGLVCCWCCWCCFAAPSA